MMARARWSCVLGALLAGACGAAPEAGQGAGPPGPVVVRTDPAAAADCPYGGSIVLSGTDNNDDGALEDAEVLTRTVVCKPAPAGPPPPIVLHLVPEPPGAHCSAGGTAVQSGPDRNGNGVLDDSEVSHVDYACAQALLTRLAAEPPGPNCIAGGLAFLAGRDLDGDGALEDTEVETTELECGDVVLRDVAIHTDADVAALAGIREITGAILIQLTNLTAVSLPHLEHIGGALQVLDNVALTRLDLPALQGVDGDFTLSSDGLTAVACPALQRVGRFALDLVPLPDLTGFPALTEIGGDVQIDGTALAALELSTLSIGGDLEIKSNDDLARIVATLPDHVGSVSIDSNPRLEAVDLSVVPRLGATTQTGGVAVTGDQLAHVALAADRVGSLDINGPRITDIALDVAAFDHDVSLTDIPVPFSVALSSPRGGGIEIGEDLKVLNAALQAFHSTAPVTIAGFGEFIQTGLQTLDLQQPLTVAGGLLIEGNAQLAEVAPIEFRGNNLQVIGNAALSSISFLPLPGGNELSLLVITDNPVLTGAPSLATVTRVGSIDVERNPMLGSLFGPGLTSAGSMTIDDNASLTSLQFPRLESGMLDLDVSRNASLTTLELPALPEVDDQLLLQSNPQLRDIAFDALAHSGRFLVTDNPLLPSCEVRAVFAHVTSTSQSQSGNDDAATCTP